ncbi:TPA: hypothetical protein HA265_05990 [Candidatus Woesearchaeota archaeon]|nr:hypothetical protein [Candidatus Woesearchaeota archaeon]
MTELIELGVESYRWRYIHPTGCDQLKYFCTTVKIDGLEFILGLETNKLDRCYLSISHREYYSCIEPDCSQDAKEYKQVRELLVHVIACIAVNPPIVGEEADLIVEYIQRGNYEKTIKN